VRINRQELIEKLRRMQTERIDQAAARMAEDYDKAAQAESQYVAEHAADWAAFANKIRARNRKEQPVTLDDVPEGLRGGSQSWPEVRVFRPTTVKESDYLPRTEALTRLIAVLESSPDEFVSTSALDRIGVPLREMIKP
jgi:hypothetical protein